MKRSETYLSPGELAEKFGYDSIDEFVEGYMADVSHVPACCSKPCMVDIDELCEHRS